MFAMSRSGILTVFVSFVGLFLSIDVQAAEVETLKGPVHEAFLMPVKSIALQAIKAQPPKDIKERVPEQMDENDVWIPGYWAWDADRNDFIWIGGVWRHSPPGRQWIAGFWKEFEEGYVYIPGFWSDQSERSLEYISAVPPDAIEERSDEPPGDSYFWVQGHWQYNRGTKKFTWLGGRWEKLDAHWILVPAHYVWRPEGYVFVDSYWDWGIDGRGTIFASLWIPTSVRSNYVYEPTVVVNPDDLIPEVFLYYPDYSYFFCWHYYFHPDFWIGFDYVPPWWGWNAWWSLTWNDKWSLWWWWSHPGYPAPAWLDESLAAKIAPPVNKLVTMMEKVKPPANVLAKGVVKSDLIVKGLRDASKPILPSNRGALIAVTHHLANELPQTGNFRPTGRIAPQIANLPKPKFRYSMPPSSRIDIARIPQKPIQAGKAATYRARPKSDDARLKPQIRQPVFPSRRPKLDAPREIPRNVFTPTSSTRPTYQRQKYEPPKRVIRTNPYAEERREYKFRRSDYEAPRYTPQYVPPSVSTPGSSSIPGDIYTPPPTGTFQPRESIRTPSQKGSYFRPSVDIDTNRQFSPQEQRELQMELERARRYRSEEVDD